MSNLTKEECFESLNYLRNDVCSVCAGEYPHCWSRCNSKPHYSKLEKLINEHFDNPPLIQEDIDSLRGEPIWDNTYKYWIIVNTCCDAYDEFVVYDTLYGVVVDRAFEPGRYFRKQVEE